VKRKLLYLLGVINILGCTTEAPGIAPEPPVLKLPANGESCEIGAVNGQNATVTFKWKEAKQALFYLLEITNRTTGLITTIEEIQDTINTVQLERGHWYQWSVTAQNYIFQSKSINSHIFFVSGDPFSNASPAPSTAINPLPGQTVSVTLGTITIKWVSYDADLDNLTFDLFIDQSPAFDLNPQVIQNLNTSEYTIALTPSTEYYWKVVAFDGQARTESQVFSFRTTPN
jgi:hypothetical protein